MVDIQQTTTQPISDDQELAKVLAGVSQQPDAALQFEETPAAGAAQVPVATDPIAAAPTFATAPATDDLTPIKTEAINELRPLVDKLDLPPQEKFDTYLLLIRSTDDKTLIPAAHTAAQAITDEARKAQALLDIIKEIDYLSAPQQPAL